MKELTRKFLRLTICLFVFASINGESKKIVCYFAGWAAYRNADGNFDVENIDPFICTHLIYSFVGLADNATIKVLDPWLDLPDGKDGYRRFNDLKNVNPSLKTLIAIGGWNEGSVKYSQILGVEANRKIFVDDAVQFLFKFGFDGLDLDWEYPNQRGGVPEDVNTFTSLIRELKEEFDKHGFLLTAAVPATERSFTQSYDVPALAMYLDFINIMSYDFHGSWETVTGHNAPLYVSEVELNTSAADLNVNASVQAWIAYGAPSSKLVLGVGLYGRSFTLSSTNCITPRCPAHAPGLPGNWTGESGMLGYYEICLRQKLTDSQDFRDSEAMVPYLVRGNQWVGYDDQESARIKAEYVIRNNLGGAMVWSIDTDDFGDVCKHGRYPILNVLRRTLIGDYPQSSSPIPSTTTNLLTTITTEGIETTSLLATTINPEDVCKHVGYNRDPHDCSIFYMCVIVDDKFKYTRFQCASNLLFDTTSNVCNYPHLVEC